MTYYQEWMASSRHLKIFKGVARCGFIPSLALGTAVLIGPWLWWTVTHNYSITMFCAGMAAILVPGSVVLVAMTRFFPVQGGSVWVTVEVETGILALHIWKTFPSKQELCQVAAEAVQIGMDLGFKTVRIESPLLVREGRLQLWGGALRTCLVGFGNHVVVQDVPAKNMFFLRAALFAVSRKILGYDNENKHLPKPSVLSGRTAGFMIQLP